MDFEKFSDRLKGFMQSAQTLAIREGNPQITPEHLLKVLLDDPEGLASGLITKAGGRPKEALERTEAALAKLPKVSGGGAQVHMAPALGRVLDQAEQIDQTRRQLRHRRAGAAGALHGQGGGSLAHPRRCRRDATIAQCRHQRAAQGPHRGFGWRRAGLRCAETLHPRLHRGRSQGRARSRHRP